MTRKIAIVELKLVFQTLSARVELLIYWRVNLIALGLNLNPIKLAEVFHISLHVTIWKFQDLKIEVLYHIKPYFGSITPYIALKNRSSIW